MIKKHKILVVDDEAALVQQLKIMLEEQGYEVITAFDGKNASEKLTGEESVVITDVIMPRLDGIGLLKEIKQRYPWIPVIMITGKGKIRDAVDAIQKGAKDYIEKPYEPEVIFARIEKEIRLQSLNSEINKLRSMREKEFSLDNIIGTSRAIREIKDLITRVAATPSSILIEGPSGTGKELIAKGLHYLSDRKYENFVIVNCAAIPETLLESELFGYKKGAFTDARTDKKGFFEEADAGTIFLDEIGDMSVALQAKILRVIQSGEFIKIGEAKTRKVNVRIIAATNRELKDEVKKGTFREDLYFRINVINIKVPPLTQRKEDIPALVKHFIAKYDYETGKRVTGISETAMGLLMDYHWPGNIRELENMIERAVILTIGDTIEGDVIERSLETIESAEETNENGRVGYREAVRRFEYELITKAIEESKGHISKAAQKLGISRHALRYQMEKVGIKIEPEPES